MFPSRSPTTGYKLTRTEKARLRLLKLLRRASNLSLAPRRTNPWIMREKWKFPSRSFPKLRSHPTLLCLRKSVFTSSSLPGSSLLAPNQKVPLHSTDECGSINNGSLQDEVAGIQCWKWENIHVHLPSLCCHFWALFHHAHCCTSPLDEWKLNLLGWWQYVLLRLGLVTKLTLVQCGLQVLSLLSTSIGS